MCKTAGMKIIVPIHYFCHWILFFEKFELCLLIEVVCLLDLPVKLCQKDFYLSTVSNECPVYKWIEPLISKRLPVLYVTVFVLCTFHVTGKLGKTRVISRPKTTNLHSLQCFISIVCYIANRVLGLMVSALQLRLRNQT